MRNAVELIFTFIGSGLVGPQLLLDISEFSRMNVTLSNLNPSLSVDVGQNCAPQEMLTLQRLGPSFKYQNAEKISNKGHY